MPDDAGPALLDIACLTVMYAGGPPAVRQLSLTLARGQAVGVVGESGAGKTTIGLAVLGLLPRDARCQGRIRFNGVDLLAEPHAVARLRWHRISAVFQDAMNAFHPVITLGEQLAELYVVHRGARWRPALRQAGALLRRVGLDDALVRSYPHELSGGMRQRAAVAMAIALSPELVVVDEPTSALDVVAANAIVDLLNRVRRETGAALLLISHDVSVVARTCRRAAVMRNGQIVEQDDVGRLLAAPENPYTRRLIQAVPRLPTA